MVHTSNAPRISNSPQLHAKENRWYYNLIRGEVNEKRASSR